MVSQFWVRWVSGTIFSIRETDPSLPRSFTIVPFARLTRYPEFSTPAVVIWSMRWLLFRVMIGAGLIKLRSNDNCWKDLTCMNHHYETQPVPNPLSFFLHKAPESWHAFEVAANHVVELVAPVLLFCPRPMRIFGGLVQVGFQIVLILSGNLSFLNWVSPSSSLSLPFSLIIVVFG